MNGDVCQDDVVIVEFPYTDRPEREIRPAVVVSSRTLGERWPLVWVVMVTSATRQVWPGDVIIDDPEAAGLRVACAVRTAKITNVEASSLRRIGRLDEAVLTKVLSHVQGAVASERTTKRAE